MKILLLILFAFFVLVNIAVEFLRKDLSPKTDPMSSYLTGQYGQIVDLSYFALAAAIATLPIYLGAHLGFAIVCWVATLALIGVIVTKDLRVHASPEMQANILHLHVLSAGIAFVAATILLLIHGWHDQIQFLIAAAAPVSAALFARFNPKATAIEEKTYAGLVVLGFIVLVLVP